MQVKDHVEQSYFLGIWNYSARNYIEGDSLMERDKILSGLIQKNETPRAPNNMEHRITTEISIIAGRKSANRHSFKLAWLFLIVGIILGIFLSTFILQSELVIYGIKFNQLRLPLLVLILGALLLLFDRLFRSLINKEYT